MDIRILEEIGFTQGEIKVYLSLLQLGESTIGPLAKKAKVTPSKTYISAEKLKEKGLISSCKKNNAAVFQILHPSRIVNYLDERARKIQKQQQEIKEIIPQLVSQKHYDQYVSIYEGYNSIRTLYDEMIEHQHKNKEEFIAFTLGDEYRTKQANIFFKNYDVRRRELRIPIKLIALEKQRQFMERVYAIDPNIKIRYVSSAVPTGLLIFGDNVVTLLWKDEPTAFVIHSKQNADVHRRFFNELWRTAHG